MKDERSKPITEQKTEFIHTLEARQNSLKAEQASLQVQIETDYPDYYALKYPKPVSLVELQEQVLQSGELLLVYGVMKEQTLLWVVDKEVFGVYTLEVGEEALAGLIDDFRTAMTTPILDAIARQEPLHRVRRIAKRTYKKIDSQSRELADILLPAEVRHVLAGAQIVYIVPTGPLYGLPFETLSFSTSSTHSHERKRPGYLIDDHAITYLSSASLLNILRGAQQGRTKDAPYPLLAFANPVYQISAPDDSETSLKGLATRAYLDLMGGEFGELPDTEKEAREIKALLKAPEESHPLYLREEASRSTVFQLHADERLDDYRYVIFSCHGILPGDINQITQPASVLSLPDPETQQDDYLRMADVFSLRFNADLITLSACNTGRGEQVPGEGVMGLTRAFMYAGTSAISMTLWPVESQSAKLLSTELYRHLNAGQSRAGALRASKLRLIRGEEDSLYQHPFFWAPVVMFGDGQ